MVFVRNKKKNYIHTLEKLTTWEIVIFFVMMHPTRVVFVYIFGYAFVFLSVVMCNKVSQFCAVVDFLWYGFQLSGHINSS